MKKYNGTFKDLFFKQAVEELIEYFKVFKKAIGYTENRERRYHEKKRQTTSSD